MGKLAASTYGEALFSLAVEEDKVDILFEEVKAVLTVFEENRDFLKLLTNPRIVREEAAGIVEKVFKGQVCDDVVGFLRIVVLKGHSKEMTSILKYFVEQVKEYKKIGTAHVTTAVALKDTQKAAIMQKLIETTPYVEMDIQYAVDASLIGGMIIRIGDRVVDSSIRSKLNELSKVLMNCDLDYKALGL